MTYVQILLRDSKSHNKRDLEGFRHAVSKKEKRKKRDSLKSLLMLPPKSCLALLQYI